MPTGFTSILEDKPDLPFADFALRCARGMGVCIMQRDEPLDEPPLEKVEPHPCYRESLDLAYEQVRKLETMAPAAATRRAKEEHRERVESNRQFRETHENERRIFGRMLAEVEAWKPPTPEHEGLKRFMREQLTMSMPSGNPYQVDETLLSGEEWLAKAQKRAAEDLARESKQYREAVKQAEDATAWLVALRASLLPGDRQGGDRG